MSKEVSSVKPDKDAEIRITTGSGEDSRTYTFSAPDDDGYRTIKRNDDVPFQGKIMGPVIEADEVDYTKAQALTDLDSRRVLVHQDELQIGKCMGIWEQEDTETTFTRVSQPIAKIEIL